MYTEREGARGSSNAAFGFEICTSWHARRRANVETAKKNVMRDGNEEALCLAGNTLSRLKEQAYLVRGDFS